MTDVERICITDPELAKVGKLLIAAQRDGDIAASVEILRLAAEYLSSRKPMPDALADFIADAFVYAANARRPEGGATVEQVRSDRLARRLRIKRDNNRPSVPQPRNELAKLIMQSGNVSETQLKKDVAKRFDVSQSTALSWIKDAKAKVAEARDIFGGNKLRQDMP